MVDILKGESFGLLGFDFRRVPKLDKSGHFILMTPKKKARKAIKAKIRQIIKKGTVAYTQRRATLSGHEVDV